MQQYAPELVVLGLLYLSHARGKGEHAVGSCWEAQLYRRDLQKLIESESIYLTRICSVILRDQGQGRVAPTWK